MDFAGFSYLAIIAAAAAGYLFGAVYYSLLAKAWLAALGKTEEEIKGPDGKMSPMPFVLSAIAALVMAFVLAGTIGHLGEGQVTLRNGIITGAIVWTGFVVTTIWVNHAYQGASIRLTMIDAGHWLGVLLIQGSIIGLMGV